MYMKKLVIALILLFAANNSFAIDIAPYKTGQKLNDKQAKELQQRYIKRDQQAWKEPAEVASIAKHKNAELINYGIKVLDKTVLTIGPNVSDKSRRYSGNSLNCSSCHLKGETQLPGTKYDAIPFTNVVNDYPQFRKRGMSIVSLSDRVNSCMTRSMGDGKAMPVDSREMLGILAYYDWLAEGIKKNSAMEGSGLPDVSFPARKADVASGGKLYQQFCFACHAQDGQGTKAADYDTSGNYTFPPLAGNDSFNNGAGMSRLKSASKFIHANMPLGASSKTPALTIDQAYDVAAYILSLPRENKNGRDKDFPNPKFRPEDYPVPEYFNGDKIALEKAKIGPYKNSTTMD